MKAIEEMTEKEFAAHVLDNLKGNLQKIEGIKNMIRDGKQVIAYEKIQGVGDALSFLMGHAQKRSKHFDAQAS